LSGILFIVTVLEMERDGIPFLLKSPETTPLPFNSRKIIPPPF
jgi:hypothetical protein